ncbi:hypothetical protein C1H46_017373 [Malus baccata]|uniref:Secreted protein n=1 Tax=Malus baccata TaxID=106549 RepID=A0A540MEA8_MALBA|nr:hypothetical protein C1H46_017373 [Malus baccata]
MATWVLFIWYFSLTPFDFFKCGARLQGGCELRPAGQQPPATIAVGEAHPVSQGQASQPLRRQPQNPHRLQSDARRPLGPHQRRPLLPGDSNSVHPRWKRNPQPTR